MHGVVHLYNYDYHTGAHSTDNPQLQAGVSDEQINDGVGVLKVTSGRKVCLSDDELSGGSG